MIRWPGRIPAGEISNRIVHHMDWLPTFLAAAGNETIKEDLLEGVTVDEMAGREYRVHLDGYNILPLLTGESAEKPRREVFYFSDDGDLSALRFDDWKLIFLEQEAWGTLRAWVEPFKELRVPLVFNLRRDPYERSYRTSNTYYDWVLERSFLLIPAQQYVAQFLETPKNIRRGRRRRASVSTM
jgi:arylsulfatase